MVPSLLCVHWGNGMKKISVVLPTYNGGQYLPYAIESVIAQTYPYWELIIVDDCSIDNTGEIGLMYARRDSRIVYLRNEINLKLPSSLNRGFSYASGEYHTWISDDNVFLPNAFEIMARVLNAHEEIDLVYCSIKHIDSNGNALRAPRLPMSPRLLYFYNTVQACFMYRSEIFRCLNGYDKNLFLVEDYDFWLRAYRYHRFFHIEEAPYLYRIHGDSLTSTRQRDIRARACEILKREARLKTLSPLKRAMASVGYLYNAVRYMQSS